VDPLAHTLFGAALAETGLGKLARRATPTLILGANLPDIDAFAPLVSADFSFGFRRGWTHGVLALAILPALLVGIMALLARHRDRDALTRTEVRWLWGLATGAAISHPLLDWLNTYGVRFLMPFDGTWFYGDTLFVVDPWFWLLCAVGVVSARSATGASRLRWLTLAILASAVVMTTSFVPPLAKLIWCLGLAATIGLSRSPLSSQRIARAALLALGLYIGAMWTTSQQTAALARSWLERNATEVKSLVSSPMPGNPFTWRIVAMTPEAHHELFVRWLADPVVVEAGRPLPIDAGAADTAARARAMIPGTATWLRIPSYEIRERGNRCLVIVRDLRYTWDAESGFGVARIDVDAPS